MKEGYLSEYFTGVIVKKLAGGEADPTVSNQHEFNATRQMKELFGKDRRTIESVFIYLDDEKDPLADKGVLTWYDARERNPKRSEYRLFYSSTEVSQAARPGDILFIGLRSDETALVVIAARDSTSASQLCWLFGVEAEDTFSVRNDFDGADMRLAYTSKLILEELGIEVENKEAENYVEEMLELWHHSFPTTKEFGKFARSKVVMDGRDNPDDVLMAWFDMEESLFKALEKTLIDEKLREGFESADDFIKYSLSIQNRRKSRAGLSLENHIEDIFIARGIKYTRTPVTENKSKPDFIFPGIDEYRDVTFPEEKLLMLGSKSTCKDRWRQVLAEADRISHKHLLTLEPAISENQTEEMISHNLQLVVPRAIHSTYKRKQQDWLMDVNGFVTLVETYQRSC